MPSSFVDSVPAVMKAIVDLAPARILDVGPGWGKYGLMCREYVAGLDLLCAVEVPEGRLALQDAIYDVVFESDIRTLKPHTCAQEFQWSAFDLVLFIDVIEHMSFSDGHAVLSAAQNAGCRALVSTPKVWDPQEGGHNPFEKHVTLWSWEDFSPHAIELDVSTIDSIVYVLPPKEPVLTNGAPWSGS